MQDFRKNGDKLATGQLSMFVGSYEVVQVLEDTRAVFRNVRDVLSGKTPKQQEAVDKAASVAYRIDKVLVSMGRKGWGDK